MQLPAYDRTNDPTDTLGQALAEQALPDPVSVLFHPTRLSDAEIRFLMRLAFDCCKATDNRFYPWLFACLDGERHRRAAIAEGRMIEPEIWELPYFVSDLEVMTFALWLARTSYRALSESVAAMVDSLHHATQATLDARND